MTLSRRQFVSLTCGTAALAGAGAMPANQLGATDLWWTLYDPRFVGTAQAAAKLHAQAMLYAIKGDVTELIAPFMQQLHSQPTLVMHGITTDTIPFGLQQLARHRGRLTVLSRFDRDLFVWQLRLLQDIWP